MNMKLIDADELLECLWREDVSSREKIAEIVNRQPIIAYAKLRTEIVITQKGVKYGNRRTVDGGTGCA